MTTDKKTPKTEDNSSTDKKIPTFFEHLIEEQEMLESYISKIKPLLSTCFQKKWKWYKEKVYFKLHTFFIKKCSHILHKRIKNLGSQSVSKN